MHLDPEQEQLGTRGKATGAQLPRHNLTSKRHSCKSVGSLTFVRARRGHVNLSMNVESAYTCTHGSTHTQNTRKHTFGIHAEHHMGSLGAECSCRRSHWFLKKGQRAANRAKLEQIELVVEDSEHKCSRVGALSLISSILLLIFFS